VDREEEEEDEEGKEGKEEGKVPIPLKKKMKEAKKNNPKISNKKNYCLECICVCE
jgi:hypothetical protein